MPRLIFLVNEQIKHMPMIWLKSIAVSTSLVDIYDPLPAIDVNNMLASKRMQKRTKPFTYGNPLVLFLQLACYVTKVSHEPILLHML